MTKSTVDTNEACSVLRAHLTRYEERSYPELRELLGRVEHADVAGASGLVYRIDVRQSIEAGIRDADAGRVESVTEVRRSFGLPE